jgi:TatD DNase family protein
MPPLFDAHCHPQFPEYDVDRETVIQRAIDEDVLMIAVGTSVETSRQAIELARAYPGKIWAAVGIHPNETGDAADLATLAATREVIAIGETGLDYHSLKPEDARATRNQRDLFETHIALARAVRKPLIIHGRDAYADIYRILASAKFPYGVMIHFFQGTTEDAERFLDLGAYLSFAGPITFTDQYDEVIRSVPLDRILVETDAPYAAPVPHRGERNEPVFVRYVAQKIAAIKNVELEHIVTTTTRNVTALFGIKPA